MTDNPVVTDDPEFSEPDESIADVIRKFREGDKGYTYTDREETPVFDTTMSLQEVYADLADTTMIAAELGVRRKRIHKWLEQRESTGCPQPVRMLDHGYVYSMHAWQSWFKLWKSTRGEGYYTWYHR